MSSEPDPEALQQRIDDLEETVQKMLPRRRAVLAGAAGAAAGAFGMQSASNVGEASDGTAVGQIGTSSEKVNVVAHDVTSDSVDTEEGPSNTLNASPGEIQSKIDQFATAGEKGVVRLESGTIYDPGSTIRVKDGVTLDYNGAVIQPTSAYDILEVEPGAVVLNPIHDLTQTTYTARAFTLDASFGEYRAQDNTRIEGGVTFGDAENGTLCYWHDGSGNGISFVRFNHRGYLMDLGHNFQTDTTTGAFINGNIIEGELQAIDRSIRMDVSNGNGQIARNELYLRLQAGGSSTVGWELNNGTDNVFMGTVWDYSASQPAWRINGGSGNRMFVPNANVSDSIVYNTDHQDNKVRRWQDINSVGEYVDETSNRSFGTWYQNTTNGPMEVKVTVIADSGTPVVALGPHINTSESNNTIHNPRRVLDASNNERYVTTFTVPDRYYYKVDAFGDTADYSIEAWNEQY
jgi:hypothetical protein